MSKDNKIFLAIIIGAIIISGGVYLGLKDSVSSDLMKSPSISVAPKAKTVTATKATPKTVATLATCGASNNTIVTKVIDGDTVVVEGGYHVRLLGMDADEKGYTCYDPAKTRLETLVLGKQVVLERDVTDLDQYGRCLRYIFINGSNVDVQLVKEGLAVARFYEPDVKYRVEITQAEKQAQVGNIGCKWPK